MKARPHLGIGPSSGLMRLVAAQGKRHGLENLGENDIILIEVQFGGYLGEDDITPYDDAYEPK